MVVKNTADCHRQSVELGRAECDRISHLKIQRLRQAQADDRLPLSWERHRLPPPVQGDKPRELLLRRQEMDRLCPRPGGEVRHALMEEQGLLHRPGTTVQENFLILRGLVARKGDGHIIQGDFPKLIVCHSGNGISDAEAGDHQGRAATHTHKHHHQPLPIPENIPDGHLPKKTQALPQGQSLQQQPLSRLGALGTNQICRYLRQLPAAAEPGHHQHTARVAAHNDFFRPDRQSGKKF